MAAVTAGDSLWEQFNRLSPGHGSSVSQAYEAIPLSHHEGVFLARSQDGCPLFLVVTADGPIAPSMALSQVNISHNVRAWVRMNRDDPVELRVSKVECTADETCLRELFVVCVADALPIVAERRTSQRLNQLVGQLVTLFTAAARPPRPTSGLWAELLMIARSSDPAHLVRAWHCQLDDHFDFTEGNNRLEIKATRFNERWHNFSYEQLNPPAGISASIASLTVEPRSTGTQLGELRVACLDAVGPDAELRAKIDRLCVEYLGQNWQRSLCEAFDEGVALGSLQLYDVEDVPRITGPIPFGVTAVQFRSCLDLATAMEQAEKESRILTSLLPRVD